MKALFHIILFFVFFAMVTVAVAQDDVYDTPPVNPKKEKQRKLPNKINSGFVFINGKYIEPPYKVKLKDFTITVNNTVVYTLSDTINYKVDKLPNYYNFLNDSSTLDDFFGNNEDFVKGNIPFFHKVWLYYLGHYHENAALDSVVAYCRKLPMMKKVVYNKSWKDCSFIDTHGNKMTNRFIGGCFFCGSKDVIYNRYRLTDKQFRNSQKNKTKRIYDDRIINILKENEMLFFDTLHTYWHPRHLNAYAQKKVIQIFNSNIDKSHKVDSISRFLPGYQYTGKFIDELKNNRKLQKRIKQVLKKAKKRGNADAMQDVNKRDNRATTGNVIPDTVKTTKVLSNTAKEVETTYTSYSPNSNKIYAICPYIYDNAFLNFGSQEIPQLINMVKDQGYSTNAVIIADYTANDHICGPLSYQAITQSIADAGILYLASHGVDFQNGTGGIILWASDNQSSIAQWCGNDNLVHPSQVPFSSQYQSIFDNLNWDYSKELWFAGVHADWFEHYWKTPLTGNNAVVVSSTCFGANFGFLEAYGGGVAFSYTDSTQWGGIFSGVEYNNKQLFKRMNGTKDGGNSRSAVDAYANMPNHSYGFVRHFNVDDITLCPATNGYYPANGDVVSTSGTGYFDIDTWCRVGSNPNIDPTSSLSPISFTTQGNIQISNVHWDSPQGSNPVNLMSHKIVYDWSGNGAVTVHINTQNIVSWTADPTAEGHHLDFNRVTPNGEINGTSYTFTTQQNYVNVDFYADHTVVSVGDPVQFHDNSTAYAGITYFWQFGDVSMSDDVNPVHTYNTPGTYTVSLQIHVGTSYSSYYTATKTNYITVLDPNNSGDLECHASANGYTGFLDASYNGFNSPDYNYDFTFDYGDYSSEDIEINSSFTSVTHTYDDGLFHPSVHLQITNWEDNTVFEQTALCDDLEIGYYNPCNYFDVHFTYSDIEGNTHPVLTNRQPVTLEPEINGGTPPFLFYLWTFYPDPSTGYTNDNNLQISWDENPQLSFSHEGYYPVKLEVMDAEGCVAWWYGNIQVVEPGWCYHDFTVYSDWDNRDFAVVQVFGPTDMCIDMFRYYYWMPWGGGCLSDPCYDPYVNWYIDNDSVPSPQTYSGGPGSGYCFTYLTPGIHDVWAKIGLLQNSGTCDDAEDHLPVIATMCSGNIDSQDIISYLNNPSNPPADLLVLNTVSPMPMVSGYFDLDGSLSSNYAFQTGSFDFIACDKIVMENGFETGNGEYIFETDRVEDCNTASFYDNLPLNAHSVIKMQNELSYFNTFFSVSPNPFTDKISISFTINNNGPVEIAVFNTIGQKIATLVNDNYESGDYNIQSDLGYLQPGVYFCTIKSTFLNQVKKIVKL